MNADQRILQILENSACLSKGQLLGYLKHTLYPEELRAVELHLSTCALCNDALEGLELQQDPDQLLASLVPPVLPPIAVPAKEKPKEKKDIPAVMPAAAAKPAQAAAPAGNGNAAQRPRTLWLKPLGIAAALVLGFGALWYFEFRDESQSQPLAQRTSESAAPLDEHTGDTSNRPVAAAAPVTNDALPEAAEQKHKDSLLLAKQEEAKRKARKDSLILAAQKTEQLTDEAKGLVAKQAAAEKESTAVADVEAKKPVAAPAMARAKEESAKEDSKESRKALTDFELGMQKYKEKNYASALLYFKSAESDKGDPKHWDAVYYSALCNKNLDKKRRAIKLFERVIEANAPQKKAAQKQLDELQKKDK
jgi:tetratricopeptide (TPR) repeat protein